MYNDENNQYNPRPRFDPKTGERIHYDDENATETTQAESSEYRYSAGNIPFEQENNNTSYYQQSSTFQQDTSYQQAGAGQGSMNQQNGKQKKKMEYCRHMTSEQTVGQSHKKQWTKTEKQ